MKCKEDTIKFLKSVTDYRPRAKVVHILKSKAFTKDLYCTFKVRD